MSIFRAKKLSNLASNFKDKYIRYDSRFFYVKMAIFFFLSVFGPRFVSVGLCFFDMISEC